VVPLAVRWYPELQDQKLAPAPQPPDVLPDGFRVVGVDTLVRQADRTWRGRIFVAFYRTGTQIVPPFVLPFRRGAGVVQGGLAADPVQVEIVPTLSNGSPSLRDIKEAEPPRRPPVVRIVVALGAGIISVALYWWFRQRSRREAPPAGEALSHPVERQPSAYQRGIARLAEIESAHWAGGGAVDRHYQAVVNVLRDYLAETGGLPAHAWTTAELRARLPARLMTGREGGGDLAGGIWSEADLVKFARFRPAPAAAAALLENARELLGLWDRANGFEGNGHAAG
jgi:hypothetical protein